MGTKKSFVGLFFVLTLLVFSISFASAGVFTGKVTSEEKYFSLKLTNPVEGSTIDSVDTANSICEKEFGSGYKWAEFHDEYQWEINGKLESGEPGQRAWAWIDDQDAECFSGDTSKGMTFYVKEDIADCGGPERWCDPYEGGTPCNEKKPILCLKEKTVEEKNLSVDLKVNGKDSVEGIYYNSSFNVSWTSSGGVNYCWGSGTRMPLNNRNKLILWNDQNNLSSEGYSSLIAGAFLDADPQSLSEMEPIVELYVKIKCFDGEGNAVTDKVNVPIKKREEISDTNKNLKAKGFSIKRDETDVEILLDYEETGLSEDDDYATTFYAKWNTQEDRGFGPFSLKAREALDLNGMSLELDNNFQNYSIEKDEINFTLRVVMDYKDESFSGTDLSSDAISESNEDDNCIEQEFKITNINLSPERREVVKVGEPESCEIEEENETEASNETEMTRHSISTYMREGDLYNFGDYTMGVRRILSDENTVFFIKKPSGETEHFTKRKGGSVVLGEDDRKVRILIANVFYSEREPNKIHVLIFGNYEEGEDERDDIVDKLSEGGSVVRTFSPGESLEIGEHEFGVKEISGQEVSFIVDYSEDYHGTTAKMFTVSPNESANILENEEGTKYLEAFVMGIFEESSVGAYPESNYTGENIKAKIRFRIVNTEENETTEQKCDSGCVYKGGCVPISFRNAGMYCSLNGTMVEQGGDGMRCSNNFECKSNVCANGECISQGFLEKIIDWFARMFGGR